MKPELLCSWLGLPTTAWPPDAFTLLGVKNDERDLAVIEKRVQDRMMKLRSYQLAHPEEATEGMNRLAEAFIALTETCNKPVEKDTYDLSAAPQPECDWRAAPPPVRQDGVVIETPKESAAPVAKPFMAPIKPVRRTLDPKLIRELAAESDEATSDLATLEAVIERVDRTRALLHAWERLGKLLKSPAKKITAKESEAYDTRLEQIGEAMAGYPAFLGHPGKPGYRVAVQARLKMPLAMVRAMSDQQREELLFDFDAGRQLLLAHRTYLRRIFKSMRHRTVVGLFLHAVRAMANDHPLWTLAGAVVVIVVGVVLWLAFKQR